MWSTFIRWLTYSIFRVIVHLYFSFKNIIYYTGKGKVHPRIDQEGPYGE